MTEIPASERNGGDNPGDGSTSGDGGGDQAGHVQAPSSIDADLAASLALLRHMVGASGPGAGVAAGKLIVIEVTSVEWVDPVASVAPAAFLSSAGEPLATFTGSRLTDDAPSWVVFQVSDAPFRRSAIEKDVAEAIQQGKTVFVVTQSVATLLAPCVPEAADQVLQLPSFGAETLAAFIAETTGAPMQAVMPEMDFARLAPPAFRLARRAGQSADEYAARLAAMARPKEPATPARVRLTLDELHGMPEVVAWAKALAFDIAEYQAGRLSWAECDRGALLSGAPGTGKTTVARAIAEHCGIAFVATSYAQWQAAGDGHLGAVTKAMHASFTTARQLAPSILFIDEIDTVGNREQPSEHADWWRSITNALLEQLDGTTGREGVVVIGATNFPKHVDEAIRRPGRLDRQIEIPMPDQQAIAEIFRVYLKDALPVADLARAASFCTGATGAAVEQWVRGARRRARMQRRPLTFQDLYEQIVGVMPDPTDPVMQRAAVHEAGHAVVITTQNPDRPPPVAIGRSGSSNGSTGFRYDVRDAVTSAKVDDILVIMLAGRAAEEVLFGAVSAGAGGAADSDLARATKLAATAESAFGLGNTGLIWTGLPAPERLFEVFATRPGSEAAISQRLDAAYARAVKILTDAREGLELVAEALLRRIALTPAEVGVILVPRFIHTGSAAPPP